MSRLFIANRELELPKGFTIARTKQVNDIATLSDRQSNFSQKIKLDRTPQNEEAMEYLGLNGDTTDIPYSITDAKLLNDSGESEIQNGRMVVIRTTRKNYEIVLYDGYVNFLKTIENKSIIKVGLSSLNHIKNLTTVKATWDNDFDYRYNVADYGGLNVINTDALNIDFQVPSVKKSFLWQKIFDFAGWTFEGDTFTSAEWLDNWMTYPKAIGDGTQVTTSVITWNFTAAIDYFSGNINVFLFDNVFTHTPLVNNAFLFSPLPVDVFPQGHEVDILTTGIYKFSFGGDFSQDENDDNMDIVLTVLDGVTLGGIRHKFVEDYKQGDTLIAADNVFTLNLKAGDSFILAPEYTDSIGQIFNSKQVTGNLTITVDIITGNLIDFEEALIDLEMKDFVNEILWEFSLTPFVDDANKKITFLTSKEWFNNTDRIDWSSDKGKFSQFISEKYIFGRYARKNFFRHRYNDSGADYNDDSLDIGNTNLKDRIDIIKSSIYTIEKLQTTILGRDYNIYKFWDKEIKNDNTVEYKELENRFYFQRTVQQTTTLKIASNILGTADTVTLWFREGHTNFKFSEIVPNRYDSMHAVLNTSRVVIAEVFLDEIDFIQHDFKPLYFIRELGSYFIVNKIPNFRKSGLQKVELVEVDLGVIETVGQAQPAALITLESTALPPNPPSQLSWNVKNTISFVNYIPTSASIKGIQLDDSPANNGQPTGFEFNQALTLPPFTGNIETFIYTEPLGAEEGWYQIQVTDGAGLKSPVKYAFVGTVPGVPSISLELSAFDELIDGKSCVDFSYDDFLTDPTFANFEYQKFDLMTGLPLGSLTTVVFPTTPIGVLNKIEVNFGSSGFFKIQLKTNVVDSALVGFFIL